MSLVKEPSQLLFHWRYFLEDQDATNKVDEKFRENYNLFCSFRM